MLPSELGARSAAETCGLLRDSNGVRRARCVDELHHIMQCHRARAQGGASMPRRAISRGCGDGAVRCAALGSLRASQNASVAAAMATSVAPASMLAESSLGASVEGLPESMTTLQKHTLVVRERRQLRRQQHWRSIRIQVLPPPPTPHTPAPHLKQAAAALSPLLARIALAPTDSPHPHVPVPWLPDRSRLVTEHILQIVLNPPEYP